MKPDTALDKARAAMHRARGTKPAIVIQANPARRDMRHPDILELFGLTLYRLK